LLLQNAKDKRVVSRLTTNLLKVVKTDAINERGMRTIQDGNLGLLKGFEFNTNGKLGSTLFATYSSTYDRATGDVAVDIVAFAPTIRIAAPSGTTHFKVVTGAAELDFAGETSAFENDETAVLPYDSAMGAAISLTTTAPANSTNPVIIVLGVEFYQEVNGAMYPLKNGSYNALSVIEVDQV
jgi:hypothetical protein